MAKRFLSLKWVDFALFSLQLRTPGLFSALRHVWWWARYRVPAPAALQGNCSDYRRYRAGIEPQLRGEFPRIQCLQAASATQAAIWQADGQVYWVFKHPLAELSDGAECFLIRALAQVAERECVYSDFEIEHESERELVPLVACDPRAWRLGAPIPMVFAIKAEVAEAHGLSAANTAMQWQQQWIALVHDRPASAIRHLALPLAKVPAQADWKPAPEADQSHTRKLDYDSLSIVIPTRDGGATLQAGVTSVLSTLESLTLRCEICIVDNGSADPSTLNYLQSVTQEHGDRVKVLRYDAPFNYSAINNWAVRQCSGEALLLLNDDVQALDSVWLERMLLELRDEVAAVGARLCYPDGRIQHDGVALGLGGVAEHPGKGLFPSDPRLARWARAARRQVSAVTGACLLTRRQTYLELGGLNETDLQVAFNDIDYCLRLSAAGHKIVQCSDAVLIHHESLSRGKEDSWRKHRRFNREIAFMQQTWGPQLRADPFYSPHLSGHATDLSFRMPPCAELARYGGQ